MSIPAGICALTGEPCQCECHQDGVVMMHAFPCCYFPNRDREMRTTDNCSMPGPGDIRESEPARRVAMTEEEAEPIARGLFGESVLTWCDAANDFLTERGRMTDEFDTWLVGWVQRRGK